MFAAHRGACCCQCTFHKRGSGWPAANRQRARSAQKEDRPQGQHSRRSTEVEKLFYAKANPAAVTFYKSASWIVAPATPLMPLCLFNTTNMIVHAVRLSICKITGKRIIAGLFHTQPLKPVSRYLTCPMFERTSLICGRNVDLRMEFFDYFISG